jgi:hypothetical protein
MAKQIANQFTQYEFESEAEERDSCILNPGSVMNIQNKLALAALERANLEHDPLQPYLGIQREAALKGEMNAYQFLLDQHFHTLKQLQQE